MLINSEAELDIVLERRHFRYKLVHNEKSMITFYRYGDLTIKCTSDIYNIYFQSSSLTFVGLGKYHFTNIELIVVILLVMKNNLQSIQILEKWHLKDKPSIQVQ